jgi:hypothetical protein
MTDSRQQSGWKRWFTRGRLIAAGAVAAVGAIATLLTQFKTIVELFESPGPPEIHIRDLTVGNTYPVDLYDFRRQGTQSVWGPKRAAPADTGYVAQLYFYAEKKGGDETRDCIVVEMQGAKPMWKRLDLTPPANSTSEQNDQLYVRYAALAFIGADNHSVGSFKRGKDAKSVEFEVFFREKKSIRISLLCGRFRSTSWLSADLEPVNTAERAFRVRGYPWLEEYGASRD